MLLIRKNFLVLLTMAAGLIPAPAQTLSEFLKQTFEERLRERPEQATSVGRHDYDDRWTDWSKAGRDRRQTQTQGYLSALARFAQTNLSAEDRLTVRLLQYDFQQELDSEKPEGYIARVSQLNGFHNVVYETVDRMPERTVHDYENIIARLRAVPTYVDQNIGVLNEAIAAGMVQPRIVI